MAYEVLNESNVPEKITPARVKRPRYRGIFDKTIVAGDVVKLDGWLNDKKKELCEYTMVAPKGTGKEVRVVVTMDIVEHNAPEEEE